MKFILTNLLLLTCINSFAVEKKCDLQVNGIINSPKELINQVKSQLIKKGYTNLEFISADEDYKKLVLHFDTETPGFNFMQRSQMVLSDETKAGFEEKYLHIAKLKSYRIGESAAYLKMLKGLPNCKDIVKL